MNTIFRRLGEARAVFFSFFGSSEEEKRLFREEIALENVRRVFYLALVTIPVCIVIAVIFGLKLPGTTGIEHKWRLMILWTHLVVIFCFSIISLLIYFFSIRPRRHNVISKVCVSVTALLLIPAGTVFTAFDQMVTPAITPYMLTVLITALILLIPPFTSLILFTANGIIFNLVLSRTCTVPDILSSNQVNSISVTVLGMFLSFFLYKGLINRRLQGKLILRQNEALLKSNAEKDRFFSIIAHDLRSPLNGILGMTDLLANEILTGEKDHIHKVTLLLNNSVNKLYALLENLLEWSRMKQNLISFHPELLLVEEEISAITDAFEGSFVMKEINFSSRVPEDLRIKADRHMFVAILRNLLSNALKFTPRGGTIEVSACRGNDNTVEISVSDTGIGMNEQLRENLFSLSGNTSRPGTENESSSGLGLLLVKEFVDKHQGRIRVESREGFGSTVTIILPVSDLF